MGWTERAARDATSTLSCSILSLPERATRKTPGRPRRILCAVDGSLASFEALRAGFKIAAPGACVRCVYVLDRSARAEESVTAASVQDAFLEEGHGALRKAQIVFAQSWNASDFKFDTTIVETEQSGDDVAHAILRQAAEWQADAIIMGTHGQRGVARWILGSVSGRVSVLTDLPLLLTRRHLADA
ncbi:universal stress protein [Caballeronia sp. BR00000012568055]|uniref:universal stress protein n=1 Tax=Caballeronia sp. BR00000012568055 TaxID=2918761 RepID=UPI0023F76CCE|nr:universal stress protein [Caballeronia sp. BR00000012568055]